MIVKILSIVLGFGFLGVVIAGNLYLGGYLKRNKENKHE
jgi:hypothetical protein